MPGLTLVHDPAPVHSVDDLLRRLSDLQAVARQILEEARACDNLALALAAMVRCERQLELEARLIGELQAASAINVAVVQTTATVESPRAELMARLRTIAERHALASGRNPHPEA